MSKKRGYALVDELRLTAEDIERDDRRELMLAAAEEIVALIQEVRAKMDEIEALKEWGKLAK